jgi:hypothetical protein
MSYVSEASELYISLYPDQPVLSPFDYLLISEWEKQEIPLPLVLDAIRSVSIQTVMEDGFSCLKKEIKHVYADWLRDTGHHASQPPKTAFLRSL